MSLTTAIDLCFVLLSLWHPPLMIVAVMQYAARRYWLTARGFWLLAGCPAPSYILSSCLPGLVFDNNEEEPEEAATTTPQNSNNGIAIPQNDSNALLREQARIAADLVKAGKCGETEAIKLVFGAGPSSSNPRYLTARAALKEALKTYPDLTPEQEALRVKLGLEIKQ